MVAARGVSVALQQSGAGVLVAQTAQVDNSGVGILVAKDLHLERSRSLILLARNVDGQVETVLDTRGALLTGLSAGLAVGLILFLRSLMRRRA